MAERSIPIADLRYSPVAPAIPATAIEPDGNLVDRLRRPLRDLRISVTDRCNFRCTYCMPKSVFDQAYQFLPQASLLSFEEIFRLAQLFVAHGTEKLRLTGGEPLLRKNVEELITRLASLRTPRGEPVELTLTTNASLLVRKAEALAKAGLKRISVSLDALDDHTFRRMNDVEFPVADVIAGIEAADRAGLRPLKINMVVRRGVNDHDILPMAAHFRGSGHILRFIEYMDVGATNGWRMNEVMPSADILQLLQTEMSLTPLQASQAGETAERWGYLNEQGVHDVSLGEIGFISSVSKAFCSDCNRARLTTEGQLYLCLFASQGYDLKPLVRSDLDQSALTQAIAAIWSQRDDRYSELRVSEPSQNNTTSSGAKRKVEMSYIGG